MATIKVHGIDSSAPTSMVRACLNEMEMDHEFITLDPSLIRNPARAHPFLLLFIDESVPELPQPFRQVPKFEDGNHTLFESRDIIRYVCKKYKKHGKDLLGRDLDEEAIVEQWCNVESQSFAPASSALIFQILIARKMGEKTDKAVVDSNIKKLSDVLDIYEQRLSKTKKYLAGSFFSLADLQHQPYMHALVKLPKQEKIVKSRDDVKKWLKEVEKIVTSRKHVKKWWGDISSRKAWKKVEGTLKV